MGIIKKLFGGKNSGEKSADGTTIYTYEASGEEGYRAPAPMQYTEEITSHFEKVFPGKKGNVFHELVSDIVHIDVNIMEPDEQTPFWILYTNGMSDLPMTLPDEIKEEVQKEWERAEVMMFLPKDWPMGQEDFQDESNYWPIRLMKTMARFPHQYHTWLGYGHTVPNFAEYEPYAENTGLNGVIFYQLDEEISEIHATDGTVVHVYFLLPLYREEMEYKLEHGMDALMEKLEPLRQDLLILNPKRANMCI